MGESFLVEGLLCLPVRALHARRQVDSVGLDAEMIRRYVKYQEDRERQQEHRN